MKNLVIFRTNNETNETIIAGQVREKSVPQLSQIVNQVTGQKAINATKTGNTVSFNTPSHKVDFVDKDVFSKSMLESLTR